jgi:hypothetical protein
MHLVAMSRQSPYVAKEKGEDSEDNGQHRSQPWVLPDEPQHRFNEVNKITHSITSIYLSFPGERHTAVILGPALCT